MRPLGRGRLIVVGGHSRGVGKTATIEHVLGARQNEPWAAVKVSAHRHAPDDLGVPLVEEQDEPSPHTQTGRYLAAGAARAFLCRTPEARLAQTADFIEGLRDAGTHVIVESNRILHCVDPDLVLFVVSPPIDDWKASSAYAVARADALVLGIAPAALGEILPMDGLHLAGLPLLALRSAAERSDFDRWVDRRLTRRGSPRRAGDRARGLSEPPSAMRA